MAKTLKTFISTGNLPLAHHWHRHQLHRNNKIGIYKLVGAVLINKVQALTHRNHVAQILQFLDDFIFVLGVYTCESISLCVKWMIVSESCLDGGCFIRT